MAKTMTLNVRVGGALVEHVAANVGEDGADEKVSEYVRDLIRRDKERVEAEALPTGSAVARADVDDFTHLKTAMCERHAAVTEALLDLHRTAAARGGPGWGGSGREHARGAAQMVAAAKLKGAGRVP